MPDGAVQTITPEEFGFFPVGLVEIERTGLSAPSVYRFALILRQVAKVLHRVINVLELADAQLRVLGFQRPAGRRPSASWAAPDYPPRVP